MKQSALADVSPELALQSYGYTLMNPAPEIPGLNLVIGGHTCPQGSVGVEVSGRWHIIEPGKTLSVRYADPDGPTIVDHFLTKYGVHSARDMGIRLWDWTKIAGMSDEQANAYVTDLDIAGKEALYTTIKAVITENLESMNKALKAAGKSPREMDAYEKRLWRIAEQIQEGLGKAGGLTEEREAALIKEHAGVVAPPKIDVAKMNQGQRLKRAKELGIKFKDNKIPTAHELIDMIRSVEAKAQPQDPPAVD